MRQMITRYFFLPEAKVGCHADAFWLGAAAIILIFSFLGFLASRFPLCWRLAMSISLGLRVTQESDPNRAKIVSQVSSGPESRCVFRSYSDLSVVMSSSSYWVYLLRRAPTTLCVWARWRASQTVRR